MTIKNFADRSKARPMPISALYVYDNMPESDPAQTEFQLTAPNLMNESNIAVEPVTAKNKYGNDHTIYYKVTATIYYISNNLYLDSMLDWAAALDFVKCKIKFGNTGSVEGESSGTLDFTQNKLSLTVKQESIQGFWRYGIVIAGFVKDKPNMSSPQQ